VESSTFNFPTLKAEYDKTGKRKIRTVGVLTFATRIIKIYLVLEILGLYRPAKRRAALFAKILLVKSDCFHLDHFYFCYNEHGISRAVEHTSRAVWLTETLRLCNPSLPAT